MQEISNQSFSGERPLFALKDATLTNVTFLKGESPLKESENLQIKNTIFKWKYPLWYSKNIQVKDSVFEDMSRSGLWYTHYFQGENNIFQAPKLFRRSSDIQLKNSFFANAEETFWNCKNITLENVQVNGDYFGMNSENIYLDHVNIVGNYAFDGGKNIEVHHSHFVTKDAFWNCENVTIYDSTISGEYLGWNTKNFTLINCTIESEQGFCYIDHLTLKNCQVIHSDLIFEYCRHIDADITTPVMSIKNPISGKINVPEVAEIIFDDDTLVKDATKITLTKEE